MNPTVLAAIISAIISGLISGTFQLIIFFLQKHNKESQTQKEQTPTVHHQPSIQQNRIIVFFDRLKILFFKYLNLSFHLNWKISFIKYFALLFSVYLFFFFPNLEKKPKFEQHIVKVYEYIDYLAKTKIIPPIDLDKQNNNDPVVNVNWYNAKKYCEFMKGRLFTKEEWMKYLDSNDVIWNFREWTDSDTLNNCAIVRDISSLEFKNESSSYEPKANYNNNLTFRCVFNKLLDSEDTDMKKYYFLIACVLFIFFLLPFKMSSQVKEFEILSNGSLSALTHFGIGVDDSKHLRNWYIETAEGLEINYPGSLIWGSVFITSGGDAVPPPRSSFSIDLSKYKKLCVEMKGKLGNECVKIGIKDYDDPDNGTEPKIEVALSKEWKKYVFDIDKNFGNRPPQLSRLNMKKLYVVCEFVFPCKSNNPQTLYVKNISYK
jgi:hypothetical protein